MATSPDVSAAYHHFELKARALEGRSNTPVPDISPFSVSCPPVHADSRSFLVPLLQNVWAEFCQDLVELSVFGKGPTLAGRTLAPIPTPANAPNLESYFKSTRTEVARETPWEGEHPIWHSSEYIVRLSDRLKPDNDLEIQSGVGAAPEVKELNTVRNHVIHGGGRREFARLQSKYGFRNLSVAEFLSSDAGSGESIFEHWIGVLLKVAKAGAS